MQPNLLFVQDFWSTDLITEWLASDQAVKPKDRYENITEFKNIKAQSNVKQFLIFLKQQRFAFSPLQIFVVTLSQSREILPAAVEMSELLWVIFSGWFKHLLLTAPKN